MNYFDILFAKYKFEKDHPPIIKRTTGNPIVLTDAADAPLVECVTQITGSQDLHGYDKPWVGGAGKNKLPLVLADIKSANTSGTWSGNAYTIGGVTFTVNVDGAGNIINIVVSGSVSSTTTFTLYDKTAPFPFESAYYSANGCPSGGGQGSNYKFDGIYYVEGYANTLFTDTGSGASRDYSALENAGRFLVRIVVYSGATLPQTFYPMIRLSTETDHTFEPYSNICPITAYTEGEIDVSDGDGNTTTHTTTYPSAIYRGSEDVVNGEVTAERIKVVIDGSNIAVAGVANYNLNRRFSVNYNSAEFPQAKYVGVSSFCKCDKIQPSFNYTVGINNNLPEVYGVFPHSSAFFITLPASVAQTTAEANTWLSENNIVICYELNTPVEVSVTPTNLPIKSLFGYNHIESSTGDMDITYLTQDYQNFVDIIENNFENNLRTRKGGIKPLDVFRTLEVNKEPEEEEKKDEKVEDVKK